jgi:hypothetical protein
MMQIPAPQARLGIPSQMPQGEQLAWVALETFEDMAVQTPNASISLEHL